MKNIFKAIVGIALVASFTGCEILAEIWKDIKLNTLTYNADFVLSGDIESWTGASEQPDTLDAFKNLQDLLFFGIPFPANKGVEIPNYDETSKDVETVYGVPISDVLTRDALVSKINEKSSATIEDQCKFAGISTTIDVRKLFSYCIYPSIQVTKDDEKEALTWETLTKKSTFGGYDGAGAKTYDCNCYIGAVKNAMMSYLIDAMPVDKENPETASISRKNINKFSGSSDGLAIYRSLTVNDENVLIKRYLSQEFEWETPSGDVVKSKAIYGKWLLGSLTATDEVLKWTDINGKTYKTDADSTYLITQLDAAAAEKEVCIGYVVEKNKFGKVKLVCAAPVAVAF